MRIKYFILLYLLILVPEFSVAKEIVFTIHLRGVSDSKISLIPLAGTNALKAVFVIDGVKNGESAILNIPANYLPGEFVLRFDYKENKASTPYPSEKRIIINNQDLDLWVHPIYSNNPDSTWFQKDEKENRTYSGFLKENTRQKEKLGLLQNFLLNYDDIESRLYKTAISEYEKRRKAFNNWIASQTKENKDLFVSSYFGFQYVPQINWKGNEADRKKSMRENYFEGIDFKNTLIIKTSGLKEWMDGYVNLYGELATSVPLRDSLFTLAGKMAIEKSKEGNPLIFGWMVDYFFKGYESFNIEKGIKMLQPYLDDPNCLTSKRQEINRRLKGIEALVPGSKAPDILLKDTGNRAFDLYTYQPGGKYILLLFWSADCSNCQATVSKLFPWYLQDDIKQKVDIVAISVDETKSEIEAWQNKIKELAGWTHVNAPEGIRSKAANDYYILSVPVMVLLDSKTKEIISLPENIEQLIVLVNL